MTDRDPPDFGSFRPARDDGASKPMATPASGRSRAAPGYNPTPETSPRTAPVPPPPRPAASIETQPIDDEPFDQLPRVARTGPARPVTRRSGGAAAPVMRREATPPRSSYPTALDDDAPSNGAPTWLRWAGLATVGAVVAATAGAIALMIYAPVDLVRDRLIAEVKARTGRDLVIGGRPKVSFWPNVAVSVADVSLSNPPGMAGAPLVAMPRLDAVIQLWPLLSKQVLVDQLVLQSPHITASTDAQGRRNWDFADATPVAPRRVQFAKVGALDINDLPEELRAFASGATDSKRVARMSGTDGFALGRIRIIDGTLTHTDARRNQTEEVTAIDMTIEAGDAKGPLQAAGTLVWNGEGLRLDTRVMPLQAMLDGSPAQTTLAVSSERGQMSFTGTLTGGAAPRLEGQVSGKAPSLAKIADWLGHPIAGDAAQGPLTFKSKVVGQGTRTSLSDTSLQALGMTVTGAVTLDQSGARPKVSGSVRFSELNIDALARVHLPDPPARPLRAASPNATAAPTSIEDLLRQSPATPATKQVRGFLTRDGWSETPIDLSALTRADVDLKVGFGRLVSANFNSGQGQTHVVAVNRAARLIIEDLALHDGKVRGIIGFDAAHARPVLTLALTLDGVALGPLLKDAGAEGIDGKARVTINVTGMGQTERQIVDTLAGKADIAVPRGVVTGYDLGAIVRGLAQGKLPRGERDPAARTEFSDLAAAFTIARGVADNRDFRVVAREARAIGAGQIALGPRTIDFTVRPKLTIAADAPAGLGGPGINLAALDLPVRITGPLAQPNVSADFAGLLANPGKALEAINPADRREVEDTLKGVIAGDEAAKKKARDFLDRLIKR